MSDSLYQHYDRVFWQLLAQVPAPGLIDEHWFLRQLRKAGHPDPELVLHWAVRAGDLTLCSLNAAGDWVQTAAGETYQPLAPALHRRLAQARFLGYGHSQPPSWYTLAEMVSRKPKAGGLAVHFGQGRRFDGATASLLPEMGALALSFDAAPLSDFAWYQLTEDPYLGAHWLLLAQSPRPGHPLTAVVRLPTGYASRVQALETLASYCRRHFQRIRCRCSVVPVAVASELAAYAQIWLHPALRLGGGQPDAA